MSDLAEAGARGALGNPAATFLEVQKAVSYLEKTSEGLVEKSIGLSANVQVDRLALYLRRHALLAGVRLKVVMGGYDTLLPDIRTFADANVDYVLALPFFDNLVPAFEARIAAGLSADAIDQIGARLIEQYRVALADARTIPQVLVGGLHRAWPAAQATRADDAAIVCDRLQAHLAEVVAEASNATVLDMAPLAANVGLRATLDRRFYAQAKAPYALPMLDEIARRVASVTRGYGQYFYKVLALDCDNTLWGGVIGEDLLAGIKLSPFEFPGNVFWRAQQEFLGLERAGAVLCLCTKNNPADVEEVLASHPDMPIRADNITIGKINWDDKSSNLRAIARELNVGLDSIVFVDDSAYELEGVRSQLPDVTTFQVPSNISDYPLVIAQIKELFLAGGVSAESQAKSEQYKRKIAAENTRRQFASQEEYLASLELRATLSRNSAAALPRISELTLKSNQFNLTTRRYTPGEVDAAMAADDRSVYSVVVEDKLGSAGLTAVAIVDYGQDVAEVDSFLMSCRVIGRGVEEAIWPAIAEDAAQRGCTLVRGRYIRTAKNILVERFFDRMGFAIEAEDEAGRTYIAEVATLLHQKSPWVEVIRV